MAEKALAVIGVVAVVVVVALFFMNRAIKRGWNPFA